MTQGPVWQNRYTARIQARIQTLQRKNRRGTIKVRTGKTATVLIGGSKRASPSTIQKPGVQPVVLLLFMRTCTSDDPPTQKKCTRDRPRTVQRVDYLSLSVGGFPMSGYRSVLGFIPVPGHSQGRIQQLNQTNSQLNQAIASLTVQNDQEKQASRTPRPSHPAVPPPCLGRCPRPPSPAALWGPPCRPPASPHSPPTPGPNGRTSHPTPRLMVFHNLTHVATCVAEGELPLTRANGREDVEGLAWLPTGRPPQTPQR